MTDSTLGYEYEEINWTTPRSFDNPYEQFLLTQSSMASMNHNTPGPNYTTSSDSHEEESLEDIASGFENLNIGSESREATDTDGDSVESGGLITTMEHQAPSAYTNFPAANTIKSEDSELSTGSFHSIVHMQAKLTQYGNGQNGSSAQSAGDATSSSQRGSGPGGYRYGPCHQSERGGQGRDERGYEDKKNPKKRKREPPVRRGQRYACPYFKRSPLLYSDQSACTGPGFGTIHRLKYALAAEVASRLLTMDREHLYRDHVIFPCPRCAIIFTADSNRVLHLAREERFLRMDRSAVSYDHGMSKDQETQLRQRTIASQSDVEKWNVVNKILFPEEDTEHFPAPCEFFDAIHHFRYFRTNKVQIMTTITPSIKLS